MLSYKQFPSLKLLNTLFYGSSKCTNQRLPAVLRKKAGLAITDTVTVRFEKGRITLTPASELDRHIAEGLDDIKKGRTYGPFDTANELASFLKTHGKRKTKRV